MILDDRHIEYLVLVKSGQVRLRSGNFLKPRKYELSGVSGPVDQTVATQMHVLGATRVISKGNKLLIVLTARGENILAEEDESWG
jgi:hypothetical protein